MLLIFDCDGVVVDSMLIHNEVEAETYKRYGIDIPVRELARRFAGVPLQNVFKLLEKETGIHIPPHEEDVIEANKVDVITQRLQPVSGIREALDVLNDIPRCIASGSPPPSLKHMLTLTNLYDQFAPYIFSSTMVQHGKPAPDLFLHAANVVGHKPQDCVVIEDGIQGVRAARAAGMRVIGFTGGSHCDVGHAAQLVGEGVEFTFSDMRELPKRLNEL